MKYKKSMIILIILTVFLFGIASACASDMNDTAIASEDNMPIESIQNNKLSTDENNEILTDNPKTFTQLGRDINESQDIFEVKYDYTFSNESDNGHVVIDKIDFTINGNNHVLDGNKQSRIFLIRGNNVTVNNLVFINGNSDMGGAIYSKGQLTLNNVTFINNNASKLGGAILQTGAIINCNNSRFIDNYAEECSSIYSYGATLNVCNSFVTSSIPNKYGQIYALSSRVNIDNVDFVNISSVYAPALYFLFSESSIFNSRFVNLTADISAGAITIRWSGNSYIKGCEFINTKSFKNAGAVQVDYGEEDYNATIIDCVFNNASSMIGGAYIQLGGKLFLTDSNFIDNKASCDGGAVYISYTTSEIHNCNFTSNVAGFSSDYIAYGGAIYCDKSNLELANSGFINNSAYLGNAIYACDSGYDITNCLFANNTNAIYSDFDDDSCNLENNAYNNDRVITNQTFPYQRFIDTQALNLTLIGNTINVATLPSKFDLRDWGLVTPVKDQGMVGACWTFGMISAVESAMLKAFGIEFDLSEGNLFHNMLRYFPYGYSDVEEGGSLILSVPYLVGWYGPALEEDDVFDEVGKLSPFMTTDFDVFHIQDVIIVTNDEVPEGSKIKTAILKYGSLAVVYFAESDDANGYYNPKTYAQYINESLRANHAVSVIGWDDNFSKDNFLITPPGDGAWIIKNSWGTDWGDNGIAYISYYDKTFITGKDINYDAFGIVIENTIPYNKNYQHDFLWFDFCDMNRLKGVDGTITYANQFESAGDDLIAAVGTYFNESDINYTVEIYVNGQLKLTQEGLSPFCGYHTIKLNEYIPVKTGDIFKAVITSNAMPYCYSPSSRVHYIENVSFFYYDGEWVDLYAVEDYIACLKVYTVEDTDHIINYTFKDLSRHIDWSGDVLEIMHDYTFDNQSDDGPVVIEKSNLAINGNNHVLDGNKQSGIFNITGNNVTISNLVFINGNASNGGAIYSTGHITLNNVTFITNNATRGGAIYSKGILNCSNSRFIDNSVDERGPSIYSDNATLNVCNSFVTSSIPNKYGQIYASSSKVNIDNVDFVNISSAYAPALYFESSENSIINSRFVNLTANMSAGAIAMRWSGNSYIKGCNFINTKSFKNAGAVHVDYGKEAYNITIIDCVFNNASSMIGGAYIQLGGNLFLSDSNFIDNKASCDGGAVYISYTTSIIHNCNFTSNAAGFSSDYIAYGGAIYCDKSNLELANSGFINNSAYLGNAIYACDSWYDITNCLFANNTNAIYTDFDHDDSCNLENNAYNNDSVITNQSFSYQRFIDTQALNLTLINNTINVAALPSRFDLRDWGWVTPVRDQGRMGACWTFGIINAVESSLLKAYGIEFNLSEGNLFHNMLRYFVYGNARLDEGGCFSSAVSYLVGWYGPALEEDDVFDEVGKLSPFLTTDYDVFHIQDVIIVTNDEVPEGSKIKTAILNYGALAINYHAETDDVNGYYNPKTSAHYINESMGITHSVSVIGWDDNFSADNFLITPPGDGAWICKNSWGTGWGDNGIFYISYYDKTLLPGGFMDCNAYGIVIENTIPYNKNYQHDFIWCGQFVDMNDMRGVNGSISYANQFEAAGDDLIAAVGTYFNESGINYTLEIYVNDELKLAQDGVSPFCGYHTIKLDEYIPVKTGDIFRAVMTSNAMPFSYYLWSRVHYIGNVSFFYYDGEWVDLYTVEQVIACLKVYTVDDDSKIINNKDISVDYDGGKYFNVKVVTDDDHIVVGASVKFSINGKNSTVKTDKNGIAKIKITDVPGKYAVKTTYNGKTYTNKVTVKQILTASKVTVKKTAKKFTLKAKLKINGKLVKGKTVTFKFNGKTYKVKTNSKGIAQKTLNKNVIKKLRKGKTYTVKVTYLKDTIKTTVKVK